MIAPMVNGLYETDNDGLPKVGCMTEFGHSQNASARVGVFIHTIK